MIIAIGNQKGGVGKSTLATNLAVSYRHVGWSVIIVEADPSVRTVSLWGQDRTEQDLGPISVIRQQGRLTALLRDLNDRYDAVLVDLPGKDSQELRTAFLAADLALLPAQASQADVDATVEMREILDDAQDMNDRLKVAVVLNRVPTHCWNEEDKEAREVLAQTFENVCETVIHERKAFRVTLRDGLTVMEGSDRKARQEIEELADELREYVNGGRK